MTEAEWLAADDPDRLLAWLFHTGPDLSDDQVEALVRCGMYRRVEPSEFGDLPHYAPMPPAFGDERQRQVYLVHDLFGPLRFRAVAFDPSWLTSTVLSLASQMYESRDFGAMPILADALQDAGCDNEEVLDHCRGPGPHVRGCWVVDLVLGK